MPLIPLTALPVTGWRNGQGRRATIAEGDGWSVTFAWIDANAAFSDFTGHDRTTVLLTGCGFRLRNGMQDTMEFPLEFPTAGTAHSYPGEGRHRAELVKGPCAVLNVITRRDTWHHRLHIGTQLLHGQAAVVLSGAVRDGADTAGPGDVVLPPHHGSTSTQLKAITPLISPVRSGPGPRPARTRQGRGAAAWSPWFAQPGAQWSTTPATPPAFCGGAEGTP
jgi:environmental stress-induced protein Ves